MRIARRLRQLLKRKGYRVTRGVRDGLTELVATLYEHNPDLIDSDAQEDDSGDGSSADVAQIRRITCPHCGESLDIVLDLSGDDQDGIQDCTVCCSPIHIAYTVSNGRLGAFSAEAS